jgi:CHAT domain-containing protein
VDAALGREQTRPALERNVKEIARLLGRRQEYQADLQKWQIETERDHPRYVDLQSPTACSLTEARACLGRDEVALLYVTGSAESFVVVLEASAETSDGGLTIARLPGRRELAEWVYAVLDRDNLTAVRDRALEAEGYRLLVAPVADRIRGKNLVIVPTGDLCLLPFELLVDQVDPKTGAVRYLGEERRVRYAPSMTVLHLQRQWDMKRAKPERMLWALGDPVYEAGDPRAGGQPLSAADIRLQRLPNAARELAAVRDACGAGDDVVVSGLKASEEAVKKLSANGDLACYRYVHFATHGVLGLDEGRQPSLVLSLVGNDGKAGPHGVNDGLLQMDEVLRLRLNADLTVLSACETGKGRLYNGEGVRGLARAFMHAGSRGVVCSLWQVRDRETTDFMTDFYRELRAGRAAAEALRVAKLEMIRAGKPPLYWAPFVLVGE